MDYASNSHKSKGDELNEQTPERKIEPIANSTAKVKKKGFGKKLRDAFIQDDIDNVKDYIFEDIVVPGIKRAILDSLYNSISMMFGETRGGYRDDYRGRTSARVSYSSMYSRNDRDRRDDRPTRRRADFEEIEVDDLREAEDILSRLDELIDRFGIVSVADLYDIAGLSCDHTYNNYGWTSLSAAKPVRLRNGHYILSMPKAMPISNM